MGEAQKERKAINEQEKQSGGNRYAKSTNGITYGGLRKNETGGTELPALYTSHCANIGGKRGGGLTSRAERMGATATITPAV